MPGRQFPVCEEPGRPPAPRRTEVFQRRFPAESHAVRAALRAAVACFRAQVSADEAAALELVLAEVMNNIVEHSYGDSGEGMIALSIVRDGRGLSCSLSDDGVPLPEACLARPSLPETAVSTEHLPEGGFGWYLIHDLTRDLGYRREGGQNLLAFRLPLGAPGTR